MDNMVAALSIVYGPRMTMMLSTGKGVHEFTYLDRVWRMSAENIKMAEKATRYHPGEARADWSAEHFRFIKELEERGLKSTFTGVLATEMQHVLHKSQLLSYPATEVRNGVHRLVTEANAMAFLTENAGGAATDGVDRILSLRPTKLHQRTPLYVGPVKDIELAGQYMRKEI